MKTIGLLKNTIQEYAWGSRTAIAELLGRRSPADTPQAELWMGAHPKAPSMVFCRGNWRSLLELIEQDPVGMLGKTVARKFDNRLPYLFKVLAASKPLSIQAHPSLAQARKGFERENRLKIPLNAAERNYKDDNHKPECICALTDLWALNGFRKTPELVSLMKQALPAGMESELELLQSRPDGLGLKRFFGKLMTLSPGRQKQVLDSVLSKARELAPGNKAFEWVLVLNDEYPSDIGVLAPLFLNLVLLEPGQAMYLQAGELHAYLDGTGIEIMANSDNVLRGGLTPKHVDVSELLNVLNFEEREIEILSSEPKSDCEGRYNTPAEEFVLSVISVGESRSYASPRNRSIEIALCTDGEAVVIEKPGAARRTLSKGDAIVIPAAVDSYLVRGEGVLYKASVPV